VASLKTEGGRKKILICVRDLVQLHGKPGSAEIIGIAECNKLVQEFEKIKTSGVGNPAASSNPTGETPQTVKEEETQDESGAGPKRVEAEDDDDLAMEIAGESQLNTDNVIAVNTPRTLQFK
jgi:hypothetical protein